MHPLTYSLRVDVQRDPPLRARMMWQRVEQCHTLANNSILSMGIGKYISTCI